MAVPPTDQCSPSGLSPSTHFPNTKVDTWHALANEVKAEVMYLSSAGKHLISGIGKPCFWHALLCYVLQFFFFFDKLKVCGNPASIKSVATAFPTAFAHFVSLCHILVILAILQTFSFLSYLLWWSVISDFWCYYYNCFGEPQTTPL